MFKIFLLVFLLADSGAIFCQVKKAEGLELISKLKRSYNRRIDLGVDVPLYPEYYQWIITGKVGDQQYYSGNVPLYYYNDVSEEMFVIDQVAVGSSIELTHMMVYHQKIFYFYPLETKNKDGFSYGWIEGSYIACDEGKLPF